MLRTFEEKPSVNKLVDVMEEGGATVIHGMAEHGLLDRIESEFRKHLAADRPGYKSEFNGHDTLRAACTLPVIRMRAYSGRRRWSYPC